MSCLGILRSTTRRPTGTIIAPPTPCSTRAATSCAVLCDSAQRIEPTVKSTIAARNTRRAPWRSAIQPLNGMNTARLSR